MFKSRLLWSYQCIISKDCFLIGWPLSTWLIFLELIQWGKLTFNPVWHRGETLLSLSSIWIRICHLIFPQNFPNFFGGENWYHSGYFDTLPSSLVILHRVVPNKAEAKKWGGGPYFMAGMVAWVAEGHLNLKFL